MLRSTLPVCLLAVSASAQTVLHTFDGGRRGFRLGVSVAPAGDFNGDGRQDVIVGAPFANPSADPGKFQLGQAVVFSGLDGSTLFAFDGDGVEEHVGSSVAGIGDVDGDGFDDVAVGSPGDTLGMARTGVLRVFSGATGGVLFAVAGDVGSQLGEVIAAAGDVDGDGFGDVIAGAPRGINLQGAVRVYSGATGAQLFEFVGVGADDFFGRSVAGPGDVDGDGFADILAGAPSNKLGSGYVRVFSGATGAVLHHVDGDPRAVTGAGDLDGDGRADFAMGEPFRLDGSRVRVLSGLDASVLWTVEEDEEATGFGLALGGGRDVDGDGTPDVAVGAPGQFFGMRGFVRVFSGVDGRVLHHFEGEVDQRFGVGLSLVDGDGDGFIDVAVGLPAADFAGTDAGRVLVFSGSEVLGATFCGTLPNSSGSSAQLRARGSSAAAHLNLTLEATDLPASTQGLFFFGPDALGGAPFGDGLRCVGGGTQRILPPVAGGGTLRITLDPAAPYSASITAGVELAFQCWFRDAAAMQAGFNTSGGLSIQFR